MKIRSFLFYANSSTLMFNYLIKNALLFRVKLQNGKHCLTDVLANNACYPINVESKRLLS